MTAIRSACRTSSTRKRFSRQISLIGSRQASILASKENSTDTETPMPWPLVVGLVLVPVMDQGLKLMLRRMMSRRPFPMRLGQIRIVHAPIWAARVGPPLGRTRMWTVWALGTVAATGSSLLIAPSVWFCALMVGGSFSHALEMTLRGRVTDYVCLPFWPAFNLADVALTVGACGL